jgi:hypothetical protein
MSPPRNANAASLERRREVMTNDAANVISHSREVNHVLFEPAGNVRVAGPAKTSGTGPPGCHCVACIVRVNHRNFGGYAGRSALTDDLYCLRCANGKVGPQ